MNAREPFSDTALERMLLRRAERADPGDLREALLAGIQATEPRRPLWPLPWQLPQFGRSLSLHPLPLLLALLLLALLGGVLAAGAAWLRHYQSPSIDLTRTRVEVTTPGDVTWAEVAEDGNGTLWAVDTGEVTRFDPRSGEHRTWTIADDAAFDARVMTPARAGGVWMWARARILRFSGDGFAEAISAPGESGLLDEAPDGTLWASPGSRGLVRWDGASWVAAPPSDALASQEISTILALAADDVWVASADPMVPGTPAVVAHLQGDHWSVYDWVGDPTTAPVTLAEAPDGAIWADREVAQSPNGLARLFGGQWTVIDGPGAGIQVVGFSMAPDGSIWTGAEGDGHSVVAHYSDGHWTAYGPEVGLTAAVVGDVSATSAGVFVGTDEGLFRFDDSRWVPVWSDPAASLRVYGTGGRFVGISATEAWTADQRGLWHYVDGVWDGPIVPPGLSGDQVSGIALAEDGTLWVATDAGVAVLADGRWSTAFDQKVISIDIAANGSAWVGDFERIAHLTPTPTGFRLEWVSCPMPAVTLTVAVDGTVWVGGFSYSGKAGLAHFDGTTCEEVDLRSDPSSNTTVEVASIVADPTGGVVIHAVEGLYDPSAGDYDQPPTESVIRLADGVRTVVAASTGVVSSSFGSLAIGPDGQLWWARGRGSTSASDPGAAPGAGLARFDGERWIQVLADEDVQGPIAVNANGTVWFQSASGIMRTQAGSETVP